MMKIKIYFIVLLFFVNLKSFSLNLEKKDTSRIYYVGLQTKLIDILPIEVSFVSLKNNGINYLIQAGHVKTNINLSSDYTLYYYSNSYSSRKDFSHNQTVYASYAKLGFILLKRIQDEKCIFLSLNGTIAYSSETFSIVTKDLIYGTIVKNYNENNIYSSIELQAQKIYKSGISIGILTGYKLLHPYAFSQIIYGIDEKSSTYSPGQGYGNKVYLNFAIGYHFKFSRN